MKFKNINFISPNSKLKYIIIKHNSASKIKFSLYLYNDRFYTIVNLQSNLINCNINTLSLSIRYGLDIYNLFKSNDLFNDLSLTLNKISLIIYSWDSYFFKKLLIDGKAYRINKFRLNNFKLMFGRSHPCLLIYKNVFLKKKKKLKKKFMFYGSYKRFVDISAALSKIVRPNDLFTDRGIRYSKQINKRKLGKKGSTSVI